MTSRPDKGWRPPQGYVRPKRKKARWFTFPRFTLRSLASTTTNLAFITAIFRLFAASHPHHVVLGFIPATAFALATTIAIFKSDHSSLCVAWVLVGPVSIAVIVLPKASALTLVVSFFALSLFAGLQEWLGTAQRTRKRFLIRSRINAESQDDTPGY
ncbi:hypothetical protein Pla100_37440 [Neorhodopirellula pilleata]|uniref:Uncharacterized protein n=1 Tax=Neorhodopirellula pilleata TaxID=2714738 RepID=A0A5C6A6Z0_9BACT|nr:hypothetical protein Pla100_37440 [Neorhodopirellula pilleata]